MAFINYLDADKIPEADRVNDLDNIIQVHSVSSRTMKLHFDLYIQLMRRSGPLSFVQRELVAVIVSGINRCKY